MYHWLQLFCGSDECCVHVRSESVHNSLVQPDQKEIVDVHLDECKGDSVLTSGVAMVLCVVTAVVVLAVLDFVSAVV